jgi:hypothetical protein
MSDHARVAEGVNGYVSIVLHNLKEEVVGLALNHVKEAIERKPTTLTDQELSDKLIEITQEAADDISKVTAGAIMVIISEECHYKYTGFSDWETDCGDVWSGTEPPTHCTYCERKIQLLEEITS